MLTKDGVLGAHDVLAHTGNMPEPPLATATAAHGRHACMDDLALVPHGVCSAAQPLLQGRVAGGGGANLALVPHRVCNPVQPRLQGRFASEGRVHLA